MRDLPGALQLAEEVTPQLSTSGSAKLRGEALLVQADVLLALSATRYNKDKAACQRVLKEVANVLEGAVEQFKTVADLNPLRRCHYLLARTYNELGNITSRNSHATNYRKVCEFLDGSDHAGGRKWETLDLAPDQTAANLTPPHPTRDGASSTPSRNMFLPAVPSSLRPASSAHVSVPAHIASGVADSTIVGSLGACASMDNVTSTTFVLDALAPGIVADSIGTSSQPKTEHCPALAQLLALAEADGEEHFQTDGSLVSGLLPSLQSLPRQQLSDEVQTVVGPLRALYPLAAILGA
jgi:hypothetical protein